MTLWNDREPIWKFRQKESAINVSKLVMKKILNLVTHLNPMLHRQSNVGWSERISCLRIFPSWLGMQKFTQTIMWTSIVNALLPRKLSELKAFIYIFKVLWISKLRCFTPLFRKPSFCHVLLTLIDQICYQLDCETPCPEIFSTCHTQDGSIAMLCGSIKILLQPTKKKANLKIMHHRSRFDDHEHTSAHHFVVGVLVPCECFLRDKCEIQNLASIIFSLCMKWMEKWECACFTRKSRRVGENYSRDSPKFCF